MTKAKKFVIQLVTVSLLSLSFAQYSTAGVIGSNQLIEDEAREARISRIEAVITREEVAEQLAEMGVPAEAVMLRVQNMTDEELARLDGRIDEEVAGGDALAVIGIVCLVLLILEIVGVTDIFKRV